MRHICRQSAMTPRSQHEGAHPSIPFPAPQPGTPRLLLSFWLRISYLLSPSISLWGKREKSDVQGRAVGGVVRAKAGGYQEICDRSFCIWFLWPAASLWWTWVETHTWVGKQPWEVLDLKKEGRADPRGKRLGLGCNFSPAWLEPALLSAGVPGLCLQSVLWEWTVQEALAGILICEG